MSELLNLEELQQRIRDLETENKRLEKDVTKYREKAQSTEKLKSAFLANMSHAIRTPMNAIIGFSELIGMESIAQSKKHEYVKIINSKGHQLLTLIDDIIEISKIESGKFDINIAPVLIDDFLNDIYLLVLQKKLKEGKDHVDFILEKQSVEEFGQILTDSGRLQQIINNLLSYSISNTSKGFIKFGYSIKDNKYIEFFVKDSSIGLDKNEQKQLFEYFWQFEDSSHISGAGLGLCLSKAMIEMLGGKVRIDSEINKGTEIYFTLPIDRTQKINRLQSLKNETNRILQPKTEKQWKDKIILVVEDDMINYQFIEAMFEKSQVQLLHAQNGKQALELCKTINKIDLILMDLRLPEKNGYEITREIKTLRSDIPIIAQTAFALNEVREKCLKSGCVDVVSKPIEIELLLEKVHKYLG